MSRLRFGIITLGMGLAASVQNTVYVHLDFPLETLREAVETIKF